MNQKITFAELAEILARRENCTRRDAETFLRELLNVMTEVISSGEQLRINSLGTFKPVWVEDRASVNVQTGEPYLIPGHYKLTFTPTKAVREAINEPFSCFQVEVLPDDAPILENPVMVDEMVDEEPTQQDVQGEDVVKPEAPELQNEVLESLDEMAVGGDGTGDEVPQLTDDTPSESESAEAIVQSHELDTREASQDEVAQEPEVPQMDEGQQEPTPEAVVSTQEDAVPHEATTDDSAPIDENGALNETSETTNEEGSTDDATPQTTPHTSDEIDSSAAYRRGWWRGVLVSATIFAVAMFLLYLYRSHFSMSSDMQEPPVVATEVAVDTLLLPDTATIVATNEASAIVEKVDELVTDTVQRGVFLTTLSLRHYGHKAFWVYIYEENRNTIPNPNNVPVGTVLVIPPAAKYGIDATDTVVVNAALAKADEIKALLQAQ